MSDYGRFFVKRDVLESQLMKKNESNVGSQYQKIDYEDVSTK